MSSPEDVLRNIIRAYCKAEILVKFKLEALRQSEKELNLAKEIQAQRRVDVANALRGAGMPHVVFPEGPKEFVLHPGGSLEITDFDGIVTCGGSL